MKGKHREMNYIGQHDISDCGPACLAMISNYYGLKYPLQRFRELTRTGKNGTSLQGIIDGAQNLGFDAEALSGTYDELIEAIQSHEVKLPCIAHYTKGHFVIISKIKKNSLVIMNPESGKHKISVEKFIDLWSGYIITIYPGTNFKKESCSISTLKKIDLLLKPMRKKMIAIFTLSFSLYFFGIISTLTFEAIIDEFSLANNISTNEQKECSDANCIDESSERHHQYSESHIVRVISYVVDRCYSSTGSLGLFFFLLSLMHIVNMLLFYIRGKTVIKLAQSVDLSLTYRYYLKVLGIPLNAKNLRCDGDYMSRFSDAYRIRYAISNATVTILLDAVLGILGGFVLIQIDVAMTLFALVIVALYSFGALFFQMRLKISNMNAMESNAEMQSYFKEVMSGYETIKRNSLAKEAICIGSNKYKRMIGAYFENDLVGLKESTLLGLIELLGNAGVLLLGFTNVLAGKLTLGNLISFTMLMSCFTEPLKNIVQIQPTLQSAAVSLNRIYDIFDINDEENIKRLPFSSNGDIRFQNIGFQYTDNVDVIKDISFLIAEKSRTGIIGKSGCGKTTLMKLLSRLYEPTQGNIFIGNVNICEFDLDSYRENIYYVDNNPFMFENTLRYNLIERNEVTDEEIEKVCRMCLIDDFIHSIPFGLEAIIRENGDSLSQGQKQRLGIARAILHKPKILILDEAFSNLSYENAKRIFDNLNREMESMTIIIISHSEELVNLCDSVIAI